MTNFESRVEAVFASIRLVQLNSNFHSNKKDPETHFDSQGSSPTNLLMVEHDPCVYRLVEIVEQNENVSVSGGNFPAACAEQKNTLL